MKQLIRDLKDSKYFFIIFALLFLSGIILIFNTDKAYLLKLFDKHRNDELNAFFQLITKFGEYYLFVFFFFIYLFRNSRISFSIFVLGIVMPITSYFLKSYFKHPRPLTYFYKHFNNFPIKGIEGLHYHTGHNSFPSGHTMAAFALFTLLAISTKKKWLKIVFIFTAFLVSVSRIYLVQHFLEDVLFGSSIGVLLGILTYTFVFILLKNKKFLDFKFCD